MSAGRLEQWGWDGASVASAEGRGADLLHPPGAAADPLAGGRPKADPRGPELPAPAGKAPRPLPRPRRSPEQRPPGDSARRGGTDEERADENGADHQCLPRHQNAPDRHRELRGPAQAGADAQREGQGIPGRTGPPVCPPEKADGGLSGSLQSHHRQPDRRPPAHGRERLPGPDHRGI